MKKIIQCATLLCVLNFIIPSIAKAQVVVNEFSCANLSQYMDNHSDYEDWIELYNTSASPINLGGYYLSDDSASNMKWQMPSTISISANGYLRFWASNRDEVIGTAYHTNFSLKQTKDTKEWVILSDPSGTVIDAIKIAQKTQLGHSYGRVTNGSSSWAIFTTPTPNASNATSYPYLDYADKPDFSLVAGFYAGAQTLSITTTEPTSEIRYTLDGSLPTVSSALYMGPISIGSTKVVKAITRSINPDILTSFVEFDTYFINVSHTLAVVSVAASQLTTLANGTGSLEPVGSFEYFNTSQQRTARTYGEFNRHGQDSWANSQRSLDFVSRDEMGYNHSIEEQLFNTSPRDNYQRVILRASGDDNYPADHNTPNLGSAHVRDAYVHNLALHGGLNVDARRGSKCVVYLNGAYWGVYDLRDNPDDHDNTDYYYGQDKFHLQYIETWGNTWAEYGGAAALSDWSALRTYILTHNMTNAADYQYVTDRLDIKSLVDYVLINMFTVCSDWLNWNTAWWRGTDTTGTHLKWGYTLWDNDATFGHYINYTNIPNTTPNAEPCDPEGLNSNSDPEDHIGILLKLRTNPEFNQYYIARQFDLWNTVFSCENMLYELDSTVALIDPEMAQHATRWFGTYTEWQQNVSILRDFIIQRCSALETGWVSCYAVQGPYDVTVNADPVNAGSVKFNSLMLSQLPWSGRYFGGIDNILEAQANSSYTFASWSAATQTFTPSITSVLSTVDLTGSDTIVAHFLATGVPEVLPTHTPVISAYPTVTNSDVNIQYSLSEAAPVSLNLYSTLGTKIAAIANPDGNVTPGNYIANINLSKSNLPAGLYVLEFVAGGFKKSIKLIYTGN